MKLIDKESLIEHMRKAYEGHKKYGFKWDLKSTVAVIGAEDSRSETHAEWRKEKISGETVDRCSFCGWWRFSDTEKFHYCPRCGSLMHEVEEQCGLD